MKWILLALLLSYAGWAALALSMKRHYRQLDMGAHWRGQVLTLRLAGTGTLLLAFGVCVYYWGWILGPAGWVGALSSGALTLVLLLAYWPRLAGALAALIPLLGWWPALW